MKKFNKRLLAISALMITSSPALAHIGGHPMTFSQRATHFLSDPTHMGFVIAGTIIVVAVTAFLVREQLKLKIK